MFGPLVEGKLVRLRTPRTADAETMITWFEDLEATRFLLVRFPPSIDQEREWLDKMARDPNAILWTVEFEGACVGTTGIHEINWRDGYGTTGTAIGNRTVWGQGIGREVMQIRAAYAFTHLPLRKLKSSYVDGNVASGRAQASAGYREVGRWKADVFADGEWHDHILTELHRDDWVKAGKQ